MTHPASYFRQEQMRRAKTAERGYGARWQRLRQVQLRAEPLCRMCASQGRTVPATVVDHIEPHKGRHELLYDLANLQSLCKLCHDAVKASEEATGRLRGVDRDGVPLDGAHHWNGTKRQTEQKVVMTVVRGLPGAGKSTVAKALANATDAVHLEYDHWLYQDGDHLYSEQRAAAAKSECLRATKQMLDQGRSVVVSNSFSRLWEMRDFLSLAAAAGAEVQLVECWSPWASEKDVPKANIERARERWQSADQVWRAIEVERARGEGGSNHQRPGPD